MKILLTGGKSATALKLLKAFTNHEVVLADYGDVPSLSSASYSLISLGEKNEDTLAHNLLSYCLDHQIDAILPLYLFEFEPIVKSTVLFGEFGITVLLPSAENLQQYQEVMNNKKQWAVFTNGELIFTTQDSSQLRAYATENQLHGAYYHQNQENSLQLQLVSI